MRILFDQGVHNMRNKGNNAMLQCAMARLHQYWPDASLDIITVAPHLTRLYFPTALPVHPDDLQHSQSRLVSLHRFLPRPNWALLFELREKIWQHRAITQKQTSGYQNKKIDETSVRTKNYDYQQAIQQALAGYDLLVCTGGGVFYDFDTWTALDMLDRLEAASALSIPTLMFGQGIGPLQTPNLCQRVQEVLSNVDLICVRNQRIGMSTLHSLGIPSARLFFTGDDAVEMAYNARPHIVGTGIGVSLRVAGYTEVERRHIDMIRTVLHQVATKYRATLIALPISSHHDEADITYIKQILAGYVRVSMGWRMLDTPLEVIKRTGQCRLVVSGTYHGAIFALAQGIPVVALANSMEYFHKLSELSDDYGLGCQVLHLADEHLADKLTEAITTAWLSAEQQRSDLLKTAVQQIELQHYAYLRAYELVTRRKERQGKS